MISHDELLMDLADNHELFDMEVFIVFEWNVTFVHLNCEIPRFLVVFWATVGGKWIFFLRLIFILTVMNTAD